MPSSGLTDTTFPAGSVEATWSVLIRVNPAFSRLARAASSLSPTTLGMVSVSGPPLTTRSTAVPSSTLWPAAGSVLMTAPSGTVSLASVVTVPSSRPCWVSAASTAAWGWPTRSGTWTVAVVGAAGVSVPPPPLLRATSRAIRPASTSTPATTRAMMPRRRRVAAASSSSSHRSSWPG